MGKVVTTGTRSTSSGTTGPRRTGGRSIVSSGDLGDDTPVVTQIQQPDPDPTEAGPAPGLSARDVQKELEILRADFEARFAFLEDSFDNQSNTSGTHAGGGTLDLAVTRGLKDGEAARIKVALFGLDRTTGDRALYIREFAVKRTAGVTAALGGVGWLVHYTSEEDLTWEGPTAIVDVDGQAGVRLSGDGTNETRWTARAGFTIDPAT